MPREQLVIEGFHAGVICSPDAQDIPEDAAAHSLDIDPEAGVGVIRGRYDDDTLATGAVGMRSGAFIERDSGEVDLIYYDNTDGKLKAIQDFYGTTAQADQATITTDERVQIRPFTREVRVGRSGGAVQWVGYIPDEQFGDEGNTTTLEVSDAELANPSGIPRLTKVVADADYAYGIAHDDDTVYVIERTSGQVVEQITGLFTQLRGICFSENDPTQLWVYDVTGVNNGSLWPIDTSDYSVGTAIAIGAHGGAYSLIANDVLISDIEAVDDPAHTGNDRIYLAYHRDAGIDPATSFGQRLWLCYVNAFDSPSAVPTDCTPKIVGENAVGGFVGISYAQGAALSTGTKHAWGAKLGQEENIVTQTYLTSLIKVTSGEVYWAFRCCGTKVNQNNPTDATPGSPKFWAGPYYYMSSGSPDYQEMGLIAISIGTVNTKRPIILIDKDVHTPADFYGAVYVALAGPDYRLVYATAGRLTQFDFTAAIGGSSAGVVDTPASQDYITTSFAISPTGVYNDGINDRWLVTRLTGYAGLDSILAPFNSATDELESYFSGGSCSIDPVNDTTTTLSGGFTAERRNYYKASFTYDGIQEGPLSTTSWVVVNGPGEKDNKIVTVSLRYPEAISRRITHINIYRASSPQAALEPDGFYRLIKTVPLTNDYFGVVGGGYEYQFYDSVEDMGQSYEARTGINETLDNTFVDYELSTILNGCLLVARCRHDELSDAMHMIFKSRPFRFDSFNWADEYLRLPEIPTAIESFGGRLFVFSSVMVYRIDPETLAVEDTFPGCGALGANSVCKTDEGIFFADSNGVYFTNGQNVQHVGLPIRDTLEPEGIAWRNASHTRFEPILAYSSLLKQVHCIVDMQDASSDTILSFCFHVPTKRWDIWELEAPASVPFSKYPTLPVVPAGQDYGAITGKYGELYLSTSTAMKKIAGDTTRKAWLWRSRKLTMGSPSQVKRLYNIDIDSSADVNMSVSVDGAADVNMAEGDFIPTSYGKQVQITLEGLADGAYVRNVTLLFRRMAGYR